MRADIQKQEKNFFGKNYKKILTNYKMYDIINTTKKERKKQMIKISINLDLDGTICDLYGVEGWLADLESHNPRPYREAKPMVNMSLLSRYIHKAQAMGYEVNIVSWLSKSSNSEYDKAVTKAKLEWLHKHLRSVEFDNIVIVPYGTPKSTCVGQSDLGILFDDEQRNRTEWRGASAEPSEIFEILKGILK